MSLDDKNLDSFLKKNAPEPAAISTEEKNRQKKSLFSKLPLGNHSPIPIWIPPLVAASVLVVATIWVDRWEFGSESQNDSLDHFLMETLSNGEDDEEAGLEAYF